MTNPALKLSTALAGLSLFASVAGGAPAKVAPASLATPPPLNGSLASSGPRCCSPLPSADYSCMVINGSALGPNPPRSRPAYWLCCWPLWPLSVSILTVHSLILRRLLFGRHLYSGACPRKLIQRRRLLRFPLGRLRSRKKLFSAGRSSVSPVDKPAGFARRI